MQNWTPEARRQLLRARHAAQLPAPRKEAVLLETALFAAAQASMLFNLNLTLILVLTRILTRTCSPPCKREALQSTCTLCPSCSAAAFSLWCLPLKRSCMTCSLHTDASYSRSGCSQH